MTLFTFELFKIDGVKSTEYVFTYEHDDMLKFIRQHNLTSFSDNMLTEYIESIDDIDKSDSHYLKEYKFKSNSKDIPVVIMSTPSIINYATSRTASELARIMIFNNIMRFKEYEFIRLIHDNISGLPHGVVSEISDLINSMLDDFDDTCYYKTFDDDGLYINACEEVMASFYDTTYTPNGFEEITIESYVRGFAEMLLDEFY